jgi:hypothetical protein
MKLSAAQLWAIFILAFAPTLHASVLIGFIGTDPGVPLPGKEDVIIYNLTGPLWGCSSPSGIPICTPVTFQNVVLTINGTMLKLADIGPGLAETSQVAGGIFVNGSILSLSFAATLAPAVLIDDLGHSLNVVSSISQSGLPLDGSLAGIAADVTSVPEPSFIPLLSVLSLAACGRRRPSSSS